MAVGPRLTLPPGARCGLRLVGRRGAGGGGGARARAYSVKLKATCFSTAEPERRGGAQDHSLTLSAQVHTEPSERVRRDPVKYISAICIWSGGGEAEGCDV